MYPFTPSVPARTIAVRGLDGEIVDITAEFTETAPPPDSPARELIDRVRAAVRTSALPWPAQPLLLCGLPGTPVPAGADLAVAAAVLHATGALPAPALQATVLLGELGLDGRVRPTRGVLAAALYAQRHGVRRVIVAAESVPETRLAPDLDVRGVARLAELPAVLCTPRPPAPPAPRAQSPARPGITAPGGDTAPPLEVSSLSPRLVEAAQLAAAAGHPLLLSGPVGAGKIRVALLVHALLPRLSMRDSLDLTAIHGLSGVLGDPPALLGHGALVEARPGGSVAALLGGGTGVIRPGALSRAHRGVLYLDDATAFGAHRLTALRAAVDDGEIFLAGRGQVVRFPARALLVLAMTPCPCGAEPAACACSPGARRAHWQRLPGALRARMDLRITLTSATPDPPEERCVAPLEGLRSRVAAARERAGRRWLGYLNTAVPEKLLAARRIPDAATAQLEEYVRIGALSHGGATRVLRLAWTLADFAGRAVPTAEDVSTAVGFRARTTP